MSLSGVRGARSSRPQRRWPIRLCLAKEMATDRHRVIVIGDSCQNNDLCEVLLNRICRRAPRGGGGDQRSDVHLYFMGIAYRKLWTSVGVTLHGSTVWVGARRGGITIDSAC